MDDVDAFELLVDGYGGILHLRDDHRIAEHLQAMRPATIGELAVFVSLIHHGVDDVTIAEYCLRKSNLDSRTPPHPIAEHLLAESHGLIVYREQVIDILCVIGFSSFAAGRICQTLETSAPDDPRRAVLFCEHAFRARKCGMTGDEAVALLGTLESRVRDVWWRTKATEEALMLYRRAYEEVHFPWSFSVEERTGWEDGLIGDEWRIFAEEPHEHFVHFEQAAIGAMEP
jgi:DNA polymerase-3 subunit alpha